MPHLSFEMFEARSEIGGTWSLFKYPGIRSDSDMHTLGTLLSRGLSAMLAHGPDIRNYLQECVDDYDLERFIRQIVRLKHCPG